MGIKDRREREKQITRQAILTAALQIAKEDGWSALTIRKVGERIEYSGPMVYEYFANKDAILQELLQEGFRQLAEMMIEVCTSTSDFEERMLKMCDAYWQFALDNRELYQLMHGLAGVPLRGAPMTQAIQMTSKIAEGVIMDWAQSAKIVIENPLGATEIFWSILHGLVSLHLIDRVEGGEQRSRDLMHQAIRYQMLGWQAAQKS